jgi:superfamily I DNA and/or RNA helicase
METCKTNKANQAEARIVADLLRRICRFYGDRFEPGKTVGVIVPYRNQIAMIRQEVAQLGLPQLEQISIDTVERYQGSQRDVIIYSFTVTRPDQLDFLTSNCFEENDGGYPSDSHTIDRKLNVAITRARKQLLLTGNKEILSRNDIFRQLIARYQKIIY